jgi:hypothetical protein
MPVNKKTIKLTSPIKNGNKKEITEITISEPTITDLHGLEINGVIRGDAAQLCILLPRISELTESQVKNLSFKNISLISMKVTSFLGD